MTHIPNDSYGLCFVSIRPMVPKLLWPFEPLTFTIREFIFTELWLLGPVASFKRCLWMIIHKNPLKCEPYYNCTFSALGWFKIMKLYARNVIYLWLLNIAYTILQYKSLYFSCIRVVKIVKCYAKNVIYLWLLNIA